MFHRVSPVLAGQGAYIDVAGYYPQLSGGLSTGDLSSGERGRQADQSECHANALRFWQG